MKLKDLLVPGTIQLGAAAASKEDALGQAIALMAKAGRLADEDGFRAGVLEREKGGSTAVGDGVALPHGKGDFVKEPGLVAVTFPAGVDYGAEDGEPVRLVFLIAAPNTKDNVHVTMLSKLSVLLMDEHFAKNLVAARSPDEFLAVLGKAEDAKDAFDAQK